MGRVLGNAAMQEMLGVIGIASHRAGGRRCLENAVWCGDTRVKTGQPRILSMCEPSTYLTYARMQIALCMKKTDIFNLASTITTPISN